MNPDPSPVPPASGAPASPLPVRHVEQPGGGAFVVEEDGRRVANADYRLSEERGVPIAVIHHTWTDPARRGQGLAAITVEAAVAAARARGWRIRPTCSYAAVLFRRHADWGDLLA